VTATELTIPTLLATTIAEEIAHYGAKNLETGGFLVAPRGSTEVTGFAMAGASGIVRRPGLFQISERALDVLFNHVDKRDLWVPCHFHSHRFEAFMSRTDASHGINVEGFICTIVPNFECPPSDTTDWNWWKFTDGSWYPIASPRTREDVVHETLTFDEDGVDDR